MTWWRTFFDANYRKLWGALRAPEDTAQERYTLTQHLPPNASILDVCSGDGRLAIPLARDGFHVTAVDLSLDMLAAAQALDTQQQVHFVHADARALPFPPRFDAAINTQSSLGFFDTDAEQQTMFQQIANSLKPGARFLLDTIHRDAHALRDGERNWLELDNDTPVWHSFEFDPISGRTHETIAWLNPQRQRQTRAWSVRLYTATELIHMLHKAGLHTAACYDGFSSNPFHPGSDRLLLIAEKVKKTDRSQPHATGPDTEFICPISRQPLHKTHAELEPHNPILLRDDQNIAYPIQDRLPRLTPEAAISMPSKD